MYDQVEKPKINKSEAVVNSVVQKNSGNRKIDFVDNRLNTKIVQRAKKQSSKKNNNVGRPPKKKPTSRVVSHKITLAMYKSTGAGMPTFQTPSHTGIHALLYQR